VAKVLKKYIGNPVRLEAGAVTKAYEISILPILF